MGMTLSISQFEIRMHKDESVPCREYENKIEIKQWMILMVERIVTEIKTMTFDTKVRVKLKKICLRETEKQWMILMVERIVTEIKTMTFDTKVRVKLKKICMRETEKINQDILRNDGEGNLCEIDVDNYGIFSPNIKDTEMLV